MQFKKQLLAVAAATVIGVTSPFAVYAQEAPGPYVGGGFGQSDADASGLDSDTSFQIYGGYMFTENLGAEGGYASYGTFDASAGGNFEADGFYAAGVGRYPITDKFEFVGKVGVVHYGYESVSAGGAKSSGDGTSALLGVGVDYLLNDMISIGAEYDMVNGVEDSDISTLWLNITVNIDSK
jgi:OmpA-OmpF porin, OOP family